MCVGVTRGCAGTARKPRRVPPPPRPSRLGHSINARFSIFIFPANREGRRADTICTVLVPRAGPFPMLKYQYIFQIKCTEAILSNSTRKLFAVLSDKFIASFSIIFDALSFPMEGH